MSLEHVQAGDQLVRYTGKTDLVMVDRVTKTQIIIGHAQISVACDYYKLLKLPYDKLVRIHKAL